MRDSLYEEKLARLRLIRTALVGPVTYRQLLARFGSAVRALEALPAFARRGGGAAPPLFTIEQAEAEMERVAAAGARYLFVGEGLYPRLLAETETTPPVLIAKGDVRLLERRSVAMVGARNASAAAVQFARQMAHALGAGGHLVVSGLARGIDTAVHVGALESGTVAVIAGGIDVVYPPENARLQQEIGERGLLLAEQPPGVEPRARHFPYRNRIIAGMTAGTVVVEAALRSGSLITARLAADYGREVMAVPGFPLDPRAQGCNQLIREGATLVQDADEVIEAIGGFAGAHRPPPPPAMVQDSIEPQDDDRSRVTALLGRAAVTVDELIRQAALPQPAIQTVLLELELAGRIARHAGGKVSLAG